MPSSNDQFAVPDAQFDNTVNQNFNYSQNNKTALAITKDDDDVYTIKKARWSKAWAKAEDANHATPIDIAEKNDSRVDLTTFLRTYVQKYFYANKTLTEAQMKDAGLRPRSTTRTSYGTPTEIPTFEIGLLVGNIITVVARNEAGKKGKPAGVKAIRVRYFIGDAPPSEPSDYAKFVDGTKNPIKITFDKADAGKTVFIAVCYVGNNASEGRYGIVVKVNVP